MNEITTAKVQFKAALTAAGLDVYEYIPDRITPPIVVLNSGSPFLVPETIGSEYTMFLQCNLIAGNAMNEVATEELEALIESFLNALPNYAGIKRVGKPYSLATGNAEYLTADADIEISLTI